MGLRPNTPIFHDSNTPFCPGSSPLGSFSAACNPGFSVTCKTDAVGQTEANDAAANIRHGNVRNRCLHDRSPSSGGGAAGLVEAAEGPERIGLSFSDASARVQRYHCRWPDGVARRSERARCPAKLLGHLVPGVPAGDGDIRAAASRTLGSRTRGRGDQRPRGHKDHPGVRQRTRLDLSSHHGPCRQDQFCLWSHRPSDDFPYRPKRPSRRTGGRAKRVGWQARPHTYTNVAGSAHTEKNTIIDHPWKGAGLGFFAHQRRITAALNPVILRCS